MSHMITGLAVCSQLGPTVSCMVFKILKPKTVKVMNLKLGSHDDINHVQCTVSYWWSIWTISVACIVSKILSLKDSEVVTFNVQPLGHMTSSVIWTFDGLLQWSIRTNTLSCTVYEKLMWRSWPWRLGHMIVDSQYIIFRRQSFRTIITSHMVAEIWRVSKSSKAYSD